MKKKILIAALIVSMIAIMVGSSLAYFTAQDKVKNTFTVGSVKIEIYENDTETKDEVVEFKEPLVPVVDMNNPSADESYIPKVITVKNTGANDAYIRTHIAIPTELVGYLYLDLSETGWSRQADSTATVEGKDYTVFTYDHTAAVTAGNFTDELLKGAYLGSAVDLEEDANGNLVFILRDATGAKTATSTFVAHTKNADGTYTSETVSILVASEAIQAQGFSDATTALDSGFPAANPWTAVAP